MERRLDTRLSPMRLSTTIAVSSCRFSLCARASSGRSPTESQMLDSVAPQCVAVGRHNGPAQCPPNTISMQPSFAQTIKLWVEYEAHMCTVV